MCLKTEVFHVLSVPHQGFKMFQTFVTRLRAGMGWPPRFTIQRTSNKNGFLFFDIVDTLVFELADKI